MNNNKNNSLLEIAIKEMENKKKPKTLDEIINDVFQIKGIKEKDEYLSQFVMDFMLSGAFICCGEDKRGKKLWDLKERQPSSILDKDGTYYDELYDDEDVVKHELSDETLYKVASGIAEDFEEEEEDDDEIEETDEIAEDLSEYDDGDQDDDEAYDDDVMIEDEITEDLDDDDSADDDF